jgi:hypothetical protein
MDARGCKVLQFCEKYFSLVRQAKGFMMQSSGLDHNEKFFFYAINAFITIFFPFLETTAFADFVLISSAKKNFPLCD